ncbi:endonuclease domain-containing 1 protein-like [Oenanthe melanoleuca]|uniref:endonuclease domain-containing 1 protein-like n=1 Tax=Oenanthe melanoleuca TaxID=2939378 RepID=UPI0024C13DC8|nr:endonuclease domain-containing 1 protein-like [Oenanthe melanoleuca]
MLGLLLLQVLASCLCLGHSEVVTSFKTACTQFFYEKTPPGDTLRPTNAARICQVYDNQYRFATLYDKTRRIPVYSAYIYRPGPGDRFDSWFVEPQLIDKSYYKYMDTEQSIKDTYRITSKEIGESQAIDHDYIDAQGLDRGHLSPSGHQTGNDKLATFTLTNIVPQYSTLNQHAWKEYEDKTMPQKTEGCDKTYVITGAVPGNNKVPSGRVNIPSHIWSAACCVKGKKPLRAWGAIAENERNKNKVNIFNLTELEKKLAKFYGKPEVTLFKNSCSQQ